MGVGEAEIKRALVEITLYIFKQRGNRRRGVGPGDVELFTGVAAYGAELFTGELFLSKLKTQRDALLQM